MKENADFYERSTICDLAYVGALRNGETVGITLEELDLKHDRVHITKALQRIYKESL